MVSVTVKLSSLEEKILKRLISGGFAKSRSDAIRFALLAYAQQTQLASEIEIMDYLRKEFSKSPRSPAEILAAVEKAKIETINWSGKK